jgi:uncharacterized protein (TIGR03435 family)
MSGFGNLISMQNRRCHRAGQTEGVAAVVHPGADKPAATLVITWTGNRGAMRRAAVCILMAVPLLSQGPARLPPDLKFDVASFKPSTAQGGSGGIRPAPGGQRYVATNCTIKLMIQVAFRLRPEQVVGGPAWLGEDRYDMEAKAEKPSTSEELRSMLLNLLAERMNLKYHGEKREMAVYALSLGKSGARLTPHEAANSGEPWIDQSFEKPLHLKMKATSVTLDYFVFRLAQMLDRPVIDLTGLRGSYDFNLAYTRELPPGFPEGGKINGEDPDTSGPPIFEAVKQQLGLELKPQKGAVDVIVIDHAEKPAAN